MKLDQLVQRVLRHSPETLTRLACYFALAGLASLSFTVLWPKPLAVVVVLGLGETLGIGAFAFYLLAVLADYQRTRQGHSRPNSLAPSPPSDTSKP